MARARDRSETTLVLLGTQKIPVQTDVLVLFDGPAPDVSARARALHPELVARGGHASVSAEGPQARPAIATLVARARSEPRVVCVAATGGKGAEPAAAARRRAVIERVLPALVRHFDAIEGADDDVASWLLTTVVAHTISTRTDAVTLDAFAGAITASLGRGDATSTRQNLDAAANLAFYARKTAPSEADAVMARHPVLGGLVLLGDARKWPADDPTLASVLREATAPLGARHARAAVQVGARAISDHGTSPARVRAILDAVLAVPGAGAIAPVTRELDLHGAARRRGVDTA